MAEPVMATAAAKVMAPIASVAVKQALPAVWKYVKGEPKIPGRAVLAEMTAWLEVQFTQVLPEGQSTGIEAYLGSAECVTFVEHALAFHISGRPLTADGPLRRELHAGLSTYVTLSKRDEAALARVLIGAVTRVAGPIEPKAPMEKSSAARASEIAIELYLQSIEAQVKELSAPPSLDLDDINDKLETYCRIAKVRTGRVQPPSFDGSPTVPIDRIYVSPRFVPSRPDSDAPSLDLSRLSLKSRAVVLGDPGGGKTTLTLKLVHDALSEDDGPRRGAHRVVPIIVTLRDFGSFLRSRSIGIAEYISEHLRASYQVELSPEAVRWLLAVGRLRVIFDGLDELLESSFRRTVSEAIEAFAIAYPSVPVLVTSRRVGYMEAPLSPDVFESFALGGFDYLRVKEYVEKWFSLDDELAQHRRLNLIWNFLRESDRVGDIRENPLLLALMCNIYRTESYIPRNRPDIYQKCATMLFDRWDRHRGLLASFEFEAHVEPCLMHLAHMIYGDPELESGVREQALVDEASRYLQEWQYESRAKAEHAAKQFIAFCKGRAWVFTDVGLNPGGESLFQFTHRTFLEYFTAAHLARTSESIEALLAELVPRIIRGEWDVVCQLALQIKAKPLQGGPDAVLRSLVEIDGSFLDRDLHGRANLISFVARSLEFLISSPAVTRQVARLVVDRFSDVELDRTMRSELIRRLEFAATEIQPLLISSVMERITEILSTDGADHDAVEDLCGAAVMLIGDRPLEGPPEPDESEHVQALATTILDLLVANRQRWHWPAIKLFYDGRLSVPLLCDSIGMDNTLQDVTVAHFGKSQYFYGPATVAVRLLRAGTSSRFLVDVMSFAVITSLCADYIRGKIPFGSRDIEPVSYSMMSLMTDRSRLDRAALALTPEQLSDCGLILALAVEGFRLYGARSYSAEEVNAVESAMFDDLDWWGNLRSLAPVIARRLGRTTDIAEDSALYSSESGEVLRAWSAGDLNLWTPPPEPEDIRLEDIAPMDVGLELR
ncbi:NACHT domain-containing protein [Actinoplanes sp. CA-142083]|uniref:NACHT domain-containing protein n=1 Tax=Actinoplanes sp. CA-142083 TaxID=3239903 RepID=UPI003D94ACA0